jgi:hypothetical protein
VCNWDSWDKRRVVGEVNSIATVENSKLNACENKFRERELKERKVQVKSIRVGGWPRGEKVHSP